MTGLARRHCQPVQGASPARAEPSALLSGLPAWTVADAALQRPFGFDEDARVTGFVNTAVWLARRDDQHPDIRAAWRRCTVRRSTHPVPGLSIDDFICAARVDAPLP